MKFRQLLQTGVEKSGPGLISIHVQLEDKKRGSLGGYLLDQTGQIVFDLIGLKAQD